MEVKEIVDKKGLKQFIKFPHRLYKDNPYWVPPLNADEEGKLDPQKSPFRSTHDWKMWIVEGKGKILGRIWAGRELENSTTINWSWWEQINSVEVAELLFNAVVHWARSKGARYIEGPSGFTNLDKTALLTEGFDQMPTIAELYNLSYYPKILEQIGVSPFRSYVSYRIQVPKQLPEKVSRMSQLLQKRNNWTIRQPQTQGEMKTLAKDIFALMNRSHQELEGHKPIPLPIAEFYVKGFIPLLIPEYCSMVYHGQDLIGFGVTLPSYSKALQKMNGKIWPLGWWHIMRTKRKHSLADLLLIGVEPKYQKKGVTACIFEAIISQLIQKGVQEAESNPELASNTSVQMLWKDYDTQLTKKRVVYRNHLDEFHLP